MDEKLLLDFSKGINRTGRNIFSPSTDFEYLGNFTYRSNVKKNRNDNFDEFIQFAETDKSNADNIANKSGAEPAITNYNDSSDYETLKDFTKTTVPTPRKNNTANFSEFIQHAGANAENNNKPEKSKKKELTKEHGEKMNTYQLAQAFMGKYRIGIIDSQFHPYNRKNGTFEFLNSDKADLFIRAEFEENLKCKINSGTSRELIQWFRSNPELTIDDEEIERKAKQYFVFEDFTYDLCNKEIINHSPAQLALSYIHTKFPLDNEYDCP